MGQSKKNITEENFREWLASTGNLFPGNKVELSRFEKLYADFEYSIAESNVDPNAIISKDFRPKKIKLKLKEEESENLKMAARNFENIPEHILSKIQRNQNGLKSKKTRGSKEED